MPSSTSQRRTGRENDPFSCEQPVAGTPPSTGIIILGSGVRVPLPLPIKSATSEITETINIRRTTVRTTFSVTNLHGRNSARFDRRRSDGQHRTGRGARFLLIIGSQVRALVRPPSLSSTYTENLAALSDLCAFGVNPG